MESNIGKVVEMTNITEQDFTHAYGGHPFTVKAGETLTFPYDVGVHLARHLARKILISGDKGAKSWMQNDPTGNNGNGTVLFTQENEETMITKILGTSYTVEATAEKSEVEKLKEQVAKLNEFRSKIEESKSEPAPEPKGDVLPEEVDLLDRKQLISECKRLGIQFSPTEKSADLKAKLSAKLSEPKE